MVEVGREHEGGRWADGIFGHGCRDVGDGRSHGKVGIEGHWVGEIEERLARSLGT